MADNDRKDPGSARRRAASAAHCIGAGKRGQSGVGSGRLERLAFAALKEQRATRRWGIFFKLAFLAYLLLIFS